MGAALPRFPSIDPDPRVRPDGEATALSSIAWTTFGVAGASTGSSDSAVTSTPNEEKVDMIVSFSFLPSLHFDLYFGVRVAGACVRLCAQHVWERKGLGKGKGGQHIAFREIEEGVGAC